MPTLSFFPFNSGLHQENDNRLQNAGTPRAVENLVRTKNGRLVPRHDYETLSMVCQSATDLILHDLMVFGDSLLAMGSALTGLIDAMQTRGAYNALEFADQPLFSWRFCEQSSLSVATQIRSVGGIVKQPMPISSMDVAAGNGRVCVVYDIPDPPFAIPPSVVMHVIDVSTDTTTVVGRVQNRNLARCVFVGSAFFVTMVIIATGELELYRYDPSTDTGFVQLTSPAAAGAAIQAYDMGPSFEGTSFWIAIARAGATTQLRGLNTSGTVTYSAAGPAIQYSFVGIFVHSQVAATQRLHFVGVRTAGGTIDLLSYLPPATVPSVTSNDVMNPLTANRQPSITVVDLAAGASANIIIMWEQTVGSIAYPHTVNWSTRSATTHAVVDVVESRLGNLVGKLANINSALIFPLAIEEADLVFSHSLNWLSRRPGRRLARPAAVVERDLAGIPTLAHLPNFAHDASTGLSYWPNLVLSADGNAQPRVKEMKISATDRRHSAELGDVLYVAGGILHAFDGRVFTEAGGFLTRPYIYEEVASTVGSLTLTGVYQSIFTFEIEDSKGRRVQSSPSEFQETTLVGAQDSLLARVTGVNSFWDSTEGEPTLSELRGAPDLVGWRTGNTGGGVITFHRDTSESISSPWFGTGSTSGVNIIQSDTAIEDNEIIYSQGARGALSGPLEFVCPDPCVTLCASADRVLSGGLPRESSFQESRPLLVGEQVQWSNTIGFYRDVRGRVLCVARLDERRIIFTADEIFEADGPGLDDNGLGEIGAPRRLPSDVGLYGGVLGWRSMVEMSAGILFQGLSNQIYLLPRGGVTPVPIGFAIEDTLAAYPTISAAVYMNEDQTVRFCCNNLAGTESIVLLFNVRFNEWFVEGPYAFTIRAAVKYGAQFTMLTSANTVLRQRTQDDPLTFIANAWRSGIAHPWKPGHMGRVHAFWFYGTFRGNCRIRAIATFNERDTETHPWVDVFDLEPGAQFVFRFEFDQTKCENCQVDFEIVSLQNQATRGLDYTYWAIEGESSDVPNELGPEGMT